MVVSGRIVVLMWEGTSSETSRNGAVGCQIATSIYGKSAHVDSTQSAAFRRTSG